MVTELKRSIVNYILDHKNEFQIHNATTEEFKAYIFNDQGEYLIGGKEVSDFIDKAIKLLISNGGN